MPKTKKEDKKEVILCFSDFQELPYVFAIPDSSDYYEVAKNAGGLIINNNDEEYDEEVQEFVCDLSSIVSAINKSEDYIQEVYSDLSLEMYREFKGYLRKDIILHCGFAP